MKPNLNKIIQDNLDKAKFQSKLKPSLPKNTGWLDQYAGGGTYISGKALATQFGQYGNGGKTGTNPPIIVNNPNDPRLKAYSDSLSLYNETENSYSKIKTSGKAKDLDVSLNSEKKIPYKEFIDNYRGGSDAFGVINGGTNKYMYPQEVDHFKGKGFFGFLDYADQARYKKPEQEVIYQPPTQNTNKSNSKPKQQTNKKPVVNQNSQQRHLITAKDWQYINSHDLGDEEDKVRNADPNKYDIYRIGDKFELVPKKPVQPVVNQKEVHHTNPEMGEIVPIEHPNLQQGQTNQGFNRNLSSIDTREQPTNYSFHYPIEGTFDRANPQGVKYFKDRAEWQNFLDENDYNSAEEKNGIGQASGTLKKGKYGGWLSKYEEGGQPGNTYVAPTVDLRHPGGSDIQNRGFQKPIEPLISKKQVQELEKKNKRNAEQIAKAQYLSSYNQPLGRDYEANRVQKIKDWGAENGYAVTDDGKLITDDAIHKFMESKVADQLWNNIVVPIGEGVGYATGAGETYQGLKTLANLGRLGVIKGLGKDALVNLFENKLTKSTLTKGLDKKLNKLGDLADYVNLDPLGLISQIGLPHLPSSNIKVGWKWDVNTSKYIPDISYDKLGVASNLADRTYNVLPNKAQLSGTSSFRQLYNHEPNVLPKNIKAYVVNNDINNLQFFDHNTGRYIGSSQVTGIGPTYEESVEALKPKLLENKTSREFKQFIPPDYTDRGNSFLNGKPLPDINLFNDGKPYIPEEKYGGDISIPNLNNKWLNNYIKNK